MFAVQHQRFIIFNTRQRRRVSLSWQQCQPGGGGLSFGIWQSSPPGVPAYQKVWWVHRINRADLNIEMMTMAWFGYLILWR